jgi:hypothetical protein
MTKVRALVVGIDRYDLNGWTVAGPCGAALEVVHWLLALTDAGVDLDLHVFLSEGGERQALQAVADAGKLTLEGEPDWSNVDKFVRSCLNKCVDPGTQLFVYWTGHGVTCADTGDRVFICSDYTTELKTRIFNASNFIRMLDTDAFNGFGGHLIFADVCGNYQQDSPFGGDRHRTIAGPKVHRLAYLPSPAGTYTKSATAGGQFTEKVLEVLKASPGYPADLEVLDTRLYGVLRDWSQPVVRIVSLGSRVQIDEVMKADAPRHPAAIELQRSAVDVFAALDMEPGIVRRCYLLTAAHLGVQTIETPDAIEAVIDDLCGVGRGKPDEVREGLMEFMMRLAQQPKLSEPVNVWLDLHTANLIGQRGAIARRLHDEDLQKALLLVVGEEDGQIVSVCPYLRRCDGVMDSGLPYKLYPTRSWDDFVRAVQDCLAPFIHDGELPNLQVEFVVSANLLDRCFHQIPIAPGGAAIGSVASVVLRARQRLMSRDVKLKARWRQYADKLRSQPPGQLQWLRIDPNQPIPAGKGLCFAGFALQPATTASSPSRDMEVLQQILTVGAPVLYVRHAPAANGWGQMGAALSTLSSTATHFDQFVDVFHEQRLCGMADAQEAGLLWDDPSSNPFP